MSQCFSPFLPLFLLIGELLVVSGGTPAEVLPAKQVRRDRYGDPLPDEVLYRVGAARFRVGRPVSLVAFSRDGKTLLSVSGDTIRRWDAATGRQWSEVVLSWSCENTVLSPDGTLLAGYSVLVDTTTGKLLHRLEMPDRRNGPDVASGSAFSPDGRRGRQRHHPSLGFGFRKIPR